MIYFNKKTGAVIHSPCEINGGDWVRKTPLVEKEKTVKATRKSTADQKKEG